MKKIIFTVSVVALAVAAPVTGQSTTDVSAGEVLAYPHAGIALAVPEGFEHRVLALPVDIVRAVRQISDRDQVSVVVMARLVAPSETADAYADMKEAQLKRSSDVKDLKILKKTSIPVAGLTGTARLVSLTSGKTPAIVIR